MVQHLSRKELKKDEVRETLAHGAEAVLTHQKLLAYILVAGLLIGGGIYGWTLYSDRQTTKAAALYDDAMKVFQARIRAPGEPADPSEVTYLDEKNKYQDAAKKFQSAADAYPHTRPGQMARFYQAVSLEHLGSSDAARKILQDQSSSSDDLAAMAKFELAQLDDRTGQGDQAVKLYQELLNKPSVLTPKAVVMMALAGHYRKSDPAQARKLYLQVKSDYPDSAISQRAQQELEVLPGKS
ncbi:MAG: tetratricopeptide repeat protein [Candidatus Acidiferrales bacterium]